MDLFNALTSAVFDVLLAPFGYRLAWFDLVLWPVLAGIGALLVYKKVSNQAGIAAAKQRIMVHILAVVIYRDDILGVLRSTARALGWNVRYLAHNVVPLLVMIVPMTVLMVQLVAHFAYRPLEKGDVRLLEVALDPESGVSPKAVQLQVPQGVAVDAGPVRTPDGQVVWRLKMQDEGDFTLRLTAGDEAQNKALAVGGGPRKVPVLRSKTWEALLYPGEAALPRKSAFESIRVAADERDVSPLPGGEGGIVLWFFGTSLVAGFLLRNRFGVTL
ncbi:hypothetical protein L6R50_12880 [Myxococcota bacterium]|nr:hypothetical protein [Myxococcota bacterium]